MRCLCAYPGAVIGFEVSSEGVAGGGVHEGPGEDEVTGGVADATGAEVDDGRQASALDEEVAGCHVAVEPARLGFEGRGQGRVPCVQDGATFDVLGYGVQAGVNVGVVDG